MADDVRTGASVTVEANDEMLLRAIEGLVRRGDELHAQRVAELEKTVLGLQEVLRDLASAATRSAEINAPLDPTDTAVNEDVIRRTSKVLDFLEPPSH